MIIPIPHGRNYTVTLIGRVLRVAECGFCSQMFGYEVEVRADGQGLSPLFMDNDGAARRAEVRAHVALQTKAKTAGDAPRACPACGKYAPNMEKMLRRKQLKALMIVGIVLAVAAWPVMWITYAVLYNQDDANVPQNWWAVSKCVGALVFLLGTYFFFGRMWIVSASTFNDDDACQRRCNEVQRAKARRYVTSDGDSARVIYSSTVLSGPAQIPVAEEVDESPVRGTARQRLFIFGLGCVVFLASSVPAIWICSYFKEVPGPF